MSKLRPTGMTFEQPVIRAGLPGWRLQGVGLAAGLPRSMLISLLLMPATPEKVLLPSWTLNCKRLVLNPPPELMITNSFTASVPQASTKMAATVGHCAPAEVAYREIASKKGPKEDTEAIEHKRPHAAAQRIRSMNLILLIEWCVLI